MTHLAPSGLNDPDPSFVVDPADAYLRATPLAWIWAVVMAGLVFLVLQTLLLNRVPTLGITLTATDAGLRVTQLEQGLPAERAGLKAGDTIVAIAGADGTVPLYDYLALSSTDVLGSYALSEAFHNDVQTLSEIMANGPIELILADGSRLPVTALAQRPLELLPYWYWLNSLMGIVALAIGVALKAHTPHNSNTTLVVMAAIGYWLIAWTWTSNSVRELAAPLSDLTAVMENTNRLGFVILLGAAVALLWQYPVRLGPGRIWPITIGVGLVMWFMISFQLYEFPLHTFFIPLYGIPFVAGVILAAMQWRQSRERPLEKAVIRWLLISIFGSTCGAFALYAVPPLYGLTLNIPPWVALLMLLVFFFGLALGTARYRLFDVERWWVNTWLWFGLGVLIVLVDVVLITLLQLGAAGSTTIAVIVVAWIYFPLRQYIWQRVTRSSEHSALNIMPEITSRFIRPLNDPAVATELGSLLESIFDAPDAIVIQTPALEDKPRLTHHGLSMVIPVPQGAGQVVLSGKQRGRKLFDRKDLDYAETVVTLVGQLVQLARDNETVERTERERIMRDLHDDVGARLLSLIHGTHDPGVQEEATELLQTLRTSVIPLHTKQDILLADAVSKWRSELSQRAARTGAHLHWQETFPGPLQLNTRQYVNLTRIMRELLTNALKHAQPQDIWITIHADTSDLTISFLHNGLVADPQTWDWGRGQHNLASRTKEIDGDIDFSLIDNETDKRLQALLVIRL